MGINSDGDVNREDGGVLTKKDMFLRLYWDGSRKRDVVFRL